MDEETVTTVYEPPALVELGEFSEDTFGYYGHYYDTVDYQSPPP